MSANLNNGPDRVERATLTILTLALVVGVIWALVQGESMPFGLDKLLG